MGAVVVGLVATTCVDVAVADGRIREHQQLARERAEQRHELAYVRGLTPLAVRVYHAVQPVQSALDSLTDPDFGDVYAIRDAVAHTDAGPGLVQVSEKLAASVAPVPLRAKAAALRKAVDDLRADLQALHGLAGAESERDLLAGLAGVAYDRLRTHESQWSGPLIPLFTERGLELPPVAQPGFRLPAPASRTTWILNADRACAKAALSAGVLSERRPASREETLHRLVVVRNTVRTLVQALHRIGRPPSPSGKADPGLSLTPLDALARAFNDELTAAQGHDLAGVVSAVDRMETLTPAMKRLSSSLRTYGAATCADATSPDPPAGGKAGTATSA